jgi:hypothetical protein
MLQHPQERYPNLGKTIFDGSFDAVLGVIVSIPHYNWVLGGVPQVELPLGQSPKIS